MNVGALPQQDNAQNVDLRAKICLFYLNCYLKKSIKTDSAFSITRMAAQTFDNFLTSKKAK